MTSLKDGISGAGESPSATVAWLAKLSRINAAKLLREEAKRLGVAVDDLRQAVAAARREAETKAKSPGQQGAAAGLPVTEDSLALELARRHGDNLRYCPQR